MVGTSGSASKVNEIAERLAASRWASLAAILIVALVCILPGFSTMPPIDGDEPGYAVAAREMVATGDYSTIRLQTDDAEWRPRGAYWIESLVIAIAGGDPPIWVYRVPSLIAGVAAALLTWWLAIAFGPPRMALLAGLFVAASGVVGLQARLATPDAILLAATMLSAGALARAWLGKGDDVSAALFWTGLGIGILGKGIVAPAMAVAAILILSIPRRDFRWTRDLRPASGLVWLFLLISPWLISVVLTLLQGSSDGPDADFLARISAPFQLRAPPGSYFLLLPLLVGPCTTFIFLAFRWIGREFTRPIVFFAFAWGGPLWLLAELIPTKMPQNIVPAIPVIALVAAAAIEAGACRIGGRISWFYSLGPAIWPPLVAIIIPLIFWQIEGRVPYVAIAAFAVAAFLGPVTWLWIRRGDTVAAAMLSVATVIFIYLGFFGVIVPGFGGIRIGERLAALAATVVPCSDPAFAAAGYPEESLVLALGRGTRIVDGWGAADFLNSAGCRVAAVDRSQISAFRQRAEDIGLDIVDRGQVGGVNLRKMRSADVHLFTAKGLAE
jgi:4-amino-4-deoxy-L-arabinose transferase-like glycosyltransferase